MESCLLKLPLLNIFQQLPEVTGDGIATATTLGNRNLSWFKADFEGNIRLDWEQVGGTDGNRLGRLKKLSGNQDILCVNNDRYMLAWNGGDFADGEEIHHGLEIEDRVWEGRSNISPSQCGEAEATDG
ncbi:hypothetical protein COLO4_31986 [Corchorus olitorius]|uniref:Uncharacterized protein n=1 Tax=Corchorus olitorius TaxID=93759 RepID=A0A1R3H2Z2_9ROSI|nr:hypothetical protein COLO4_31986 [Corchorus olitorius]